MSEFILNQFFSEWKKILFVEIILMLFVSFKILIPLFSENIELCLNCLELRKELVSAEKLQHQINVLKMSNQKIEERSQDIIKAIPAGGETSQLYEILATTAESHKVHLQKVIPEPIESEEKLNRLNINSIIEADFENLIRFFFEIENRAGIFQLNKVEIEAPPGYQSDLRAKLRLSSYLRWENASD